jgi:hypothetical protein
MKRETVTIRVSPKTNAAINMVVSKLKAGQPGKRITQDEAIWVLIERADPDTAKTIDAAAPVQHDEASNN